MDDRRLRVVIAGGTGFIGSALTREFHEAGYEVVVLSRHGRPVEGAESLKWDARTQGDWSKLLDGAKAVVNLTGEPLNQRWTDESKKRIIDSRVESARAVCEAVRASSMPPEVWVNASAVGYYGDTGDSQVDESSRAGSGFPAEVCRLWEEAVDACEAPGTRRVKVRIGAVLGKGGGMWAELSKFARLFLGGAHGNGKQFIPWLHLEDLCRMIRWCVESEVTGAVNGVGPEPVRNADFMAALRKAVHRPWCPPAPAFLLKVVSAVMGAPMEMVLWSSRVVPKVPIERGFTFKHTDLQRTLTDLAR